jgi:hypothetical protein
MFKHFIGRIKRNSSGQSFVELVLVTVILALLLAGVVEFGFMLNHYMHVLDGAREAARYSSTQLAFRMNDDGTVMTSGGVILNNMPFYFLSAAKAAETMDPVVLDPANTDDIIISVFSVSGSNHPRFPSGTGWSLCENYGAFKAYFTGTLGVPVPIRLSNPGWSSGCTVQTTKFGDAEFAASGADAAPPTGVLVVEIFYGYPQTLALPLFSGYDFFGTKFTIIPNPIPLYLYTVMPLSSAEPTPTP